MTLNIEFVLHDMAKTALQNEEIAAEIYPWLAQISPQQFIASVDDLPITATIIRNWIAHSRAVVTAHINQAVVGFCAATTRESFLAANAIEFCHLAVHPNFHGKGIGANLIAHLSTWAFGNGFTKTYGRVLPTNQNCLSFVKATGWSIIPAGQHHHLSDEFVWVQYTKH